MKQACTYLNTAVGLRQIHISVHMFPYENRLKLHAFNVRKFKKHISKEDTQCDKLDSPAVFLKKKLNSTRALCCLSGAYP